MGMNKHGFYRPNPESKVIQIMAPPVKMWAIYQDNGKEMRIPIIALSLHEDGDIGCIEADPHGEFCFQCDNCLRIETEGEQNGQ